MTDDETIIAKMRRAWWVWIGDKATAERISANAPLDIFGPRTVSQDPFGSWGVYIDIGGLGEPGTDQMADEHISHLKAWARSVWDAARHA